MADRAIRSGAYDVGMAIGFDKHPPGAFNADPAEYGLGDWYGETGLMLTTQFFAMKIQRYLHDHDIDPAVLAKIAAKAYRNGALNPNAWRRTPLSVDEIAGVGDGQRPADQVHVLLAGRGRGGAGAVPRPTSPTASPAPPVWLRAVRDALAPVRHVRGVQPVARARAGRRARPSIAARAAFEQAGIGPDDVDVAQIQDTESGAELMHMAETGLCEHGEQEALIETGATEIDGRLPINTDGGCLANGEPIGASGLRQVHENVLQLRGDAGDRQVPGEPTVALHPRLRRARASARARC